jgi:hypothetical protein
MKSRKNIMGLFEIIFIAAGLSMDAFAISITLGLSVEEPKIKNPRSKLREFKISH